MEVCDERAPQIAHGDTRVGQTRVERLLGLRRMHPRIDQCPAAFALDQV